MKKLVAVLAKVKSEALFLEKFWLPYYSKFFDVQDLHVHAEQSFDGTEELCRKFGVTLTEIPPGTVQHGKNNVYIVEVIDRLLQDYECVLFAESPDDIITPGPRHGSNLRTYVDEFIASEDTYRFLTCYNVTQDVDKEPVYTGGPLLSTRGTFVRCPQYDNSFLWKTRPIWGRGWHDLVGVNNGKRICGGGDTQGEEKRLYNLHIHYADFGMCNARHQVRQSTYSYDERQNNLYSCQIDGELLTVMKHMHDFPHLCFSDAIKETLDASHWMRQII